MLKIFLFSLLLSTQTSHVSFMGVECIPEKGVIKMFVKMNYGDFVNDYRYTVNDDQGFDRNVEIDTAIVLVSKYVERRIQMFAGEKNLRGHLTGFHSADGEINIEFLYSYDSKSRNFKVKNSFLDGITNTQSVLLIFKHKNFEEGIKLTAGAPEKIFVVN